MKTIAELAWEVPDNLVEDQLILHIPTDNGVKICYCAVGWMCHEAGLTDDEINKLDDEDEIEIYDKVGVIYGLSAEQVADIIKANDRSADEERQLNIRRVLLEIAGA